MARSREESPEDIIDKLVEAKDGELEELDEQANLQVAKDLAEENELQEHLVEKLLERQDDLGLSVARAVAQQNKMTQYLILFEVTKALGIAPWDVSIDEDDNVYTLTEIAGRRGSRKEWKAVEDEETAVELARERVKNDLEYNPENFNQDFVQRHMNMDKLEKWVRDATLEDEYWNEIASSEPERFWEDAARWGVDDLPEPDEDGNMPDDVDDKYIDEIKEKQADENAGDPIRYLTDLGYEMEKIIEIAGIDINSAVEEAISSDGWSHFVNSYDGGYSNTAAPYRFTYWREN